ncbi:MAG: hypothetical protein IRZ28_08585 [Steroidobacteraceae bacterium]|nr:hypothetical protein [Steroidobacteraceae bacterium]
MAGASAATLFSDNADSVSSVSAALGSGLWARIEGNVAISKNYAHSGTQSYQLSYNANEAQSFLGVRIAGRKHVFLRWWELRERAGDFPGAQDYDWSAEKTIRFRSATIGSTGVDYCVGWEAAGSQVGTSGTDGPGQMVIFGNSSASNGRDLLRVTPSFERGKWYMFEVEIDLGTRGQSNGALRIWQNDKLLGQVTGVNLLPSTDANIEEIWVGGWYSGLSPNPSPARRYVDDIVVADAKIGGYDGKPPVVPNPPTSVSVQ